MGSIGSMGGDRAGQLEIEGWAEIMREIERQAKNRRKFSVKSAKSWLNHEREIVKGERSRVKRRKKERGGRTPHGGGADSHQDSDGRAP